MERKKKLFFLWIIIIFTLLGSIALLFNNKAKMKEKIAKNVILSEFPVTVEPAKIEELKLTLEYVGSAYAFADVNIQSESIGKIAEIKANMGDYVKKGTILAKLDDEMKLANLQSAEANFQKAKKDYQRFEQLFKEKSINESQLDQAKFLLETAEAQYRIAKKQVEDTKIVAPFSGLITMRNAEVGAVVSTNTILFNLVDISTLRIKIQVPENDILKIKEGDKVQIISDLKPDLILDGKIQSIGAKADESRTFPVEILVKNERNFLRAGMFVRVRIPSISKGKTLLIPREALVGSIKNPQVYVVENQIARLRNIKLGTEVGKKLEVLSGLSEGELVVTNGLINLKDSTKVILVQQQRGNYDNY
ncbi:MAG: efflux RND transporter periplasmic adaptor subunit [Candidatus Kapaibacteriales bacterium]